MKKIHLLTTALIFLIANTTFAQTNAKKPDNKGFYVGASLMGTAWTMPDYWDDAESGGGFGLRAGYEFNTHFAAFLSFDGSNIDPDEGDDYTLGHFDIGGEGRLGSATSSFRPFLRLSFVGMSAQADSPSGDVEFNGAGVAIGPGVYYFASENISLELSYVHSWINLSEAKVGSISQDIDENAQTGRLSFGVAYHF